MITWTDQKIKAQRLSKNDTDNVLTQLEQDMNTGYHMFNAKLSRYYTRKQQFADLVENQGIYQTPVDSIRVMGVSCYVSDSYEVPLEEIRSEQQWRQIVSVKNIASNWPTYYYVLGDDQISIWPVPSQDFTNGIRYWYQPQDYDLSVDDTSNVDSNDFTTVVSATVTVTNQSTTVTASSGVFNTGMASLYFQVLGQTDDTAYEIASATSTVLTLKSKYVGTSGSGLDWRIGQMGIIPKEYTDAPMHYALGNFFSAEGNEVRSQFHLGTDEAPGMFYKMVQDCKQEYSSSNQSGVITGTDDGLNPYLIPPLPNP